MRVDHQAGRRSSWGGLRSAIGDGARGGGVSARGGRSPIGRPCAAPEREGMRRRLLGEGWAGGGGGGGGGGGVGGGWAGGAGCGERWRGRGGAAGQRPSEPWPPERRARSGRAPPAYRRASAATK